MPSLGRKEKVTLTIDVKRSPVSVDYSFVNFKAVRTSKTASKTISIMNKFTKPVKYTLSFKSNPSSAFTVDNATNVLQPNARFSHSITFKPTISSPTSAELLIQYDNGLGEQIVNLLGEGFDLKERLTLVTSERKDLTEGVKAKNDVDFGRVLLGHERTFAVDITNDGKYPFTFEWNLSGTGVENLKMEPAVGSLEAGQKATVTCSFYPTKPVKLTKMSAICSINKEKIYAIAINGQGAKNKLKMSASEVVFGPTFVSDSSADNERAIQLTNAEDIPVQFTVTSSNPLVFMPSIDQGSMEPNESSTIKVNFVPIQAEDYKEELIIRINEINEYRIPLKGLGVAQNIVIDAKSKYLNFGVINYGQTVKKAVKMKNECPLPVKIQLGPEETLRHLNEMGFRVEPVNVSVKPREVATIVVYANPKMRFSSLKETIGVYADSRLVNDVTITAACQGVDIDVSDSEIIFGPVMPKSIATKTIILRNKGESGTKFNWETSKLGSAITVEPADGILDPRSEIPIKFTFAPKNAVEIKLDQLLCHFAAFKSLPISVHGSCINQMSYTETLRFTTNARQTDSKSVSIHNRTSQVWKLYPTLVGSYFSGASELIVEPNQTKQYPIMYSPAVPTSEESKHEATLSITLPDKTILTYKLIGAAEKPLPVEVINRDVTCRNYHQETVTVKNWLSSFQKLKVSFEIMNGDPTGTIKGEEFLEISASTSKTFSLSFYAFREGLYPVKLAFTNPITGDFVWYVLNFKAVPSEFVESIYISSIVRQKTIKPFMLKNPTDNTITIAVSCAHSEITVPNTINIPPRYVLFK